MLLKKFFINHLQLITLLFCLVVGFFFRVYNFDWDQGLLFHPDERNIANAVTKIHFFSELNPRFFAYNGFSIYLYRAAADALVTITKNTAWVMDWGKIDDIGRIFSAFFSTTTIFPLFFVGKKLFGKKIALLSSIFYVFTVTSIQHAHFTTTESSLTFFAILLCLLSILWMEKPTALRAALIGVIYGISLATKTSALMMILFPATAIMLSALRERKQAKKLLSLLPHVFLFICMTGFFAFLFSPYSLLDFKDFYTSMQYESGVATGSLPVVYTLQFNGSTPYLFQIENFVWQLGPLLAIFSVVGFLFVILEPPKKKEKNRLIFWIFPLAYFLYVGSWHTKFLRYMVPLIPFFILSASYFLVTLRKRFTLFGNALIILTLITTICWAFAFFAIYTRPQTRVEASEYIYTHVAPRSVILTEAWDDGLPVSVGPFNGSIYQGKQLDMYATDDTQKIVYLSSMLSSADYIAINSRRIYGTLIHLTTLYPITSWYYRLLFAGKLGYEKVGTFSSYPEIFGITINDDSSEETFQVYDHPKAFVFKNVKHYTQNQLIKILNSSSI